MVVVCIASASSALIVKGAGFFFSPAAPTWCASFLAPPPPLIASLLHTAIMPRGFLKDLRQKSPLRDLARAFVPADGKHVVLRVDAGCAVVRGNLRAGHLRARELDVEHTARCIVSSVQPFLDLVGVSATTALPATVASVRMEVVLEGPKRGPCERGRGGKGVTSTNIQ